MKSVAKQKGACAKMGKYKLNDEGPATSSMPHPTDFLAQHEEGNFKRNKNIFRAHTSFGPATKPKLKVNSIMAKTIQPYEAEVDEGSATPTPKPKKPAPKLPPEAENDGPPTDSKGNYIKPRPYAKGGSVSSASSRGDGCCAKGKTKGRIC